MLLQDTMDYFNNRFEQERHLSYRPFILDQGVVTGLFGPTRSGPIRIGSAFAPVRRLSAGNRVIARVSASSVAHYDDDFQQSRIVEAGDLLANTLKHAIGFQPIINLDRLCRTVHLLNYVAADDAEGRLIVDVNPRHIIGVKHGHGAYFEELLVKCGLETGRIVISMTVDGFYARHPTQLLEGLHNYRHRGYRIAINIGQQYRTHDIRELLKKLAPDYLRVSMPGLIDGNPELENSWHAELGALKQLMDALAGQVILRQQDPRSQALTASRLAIDLIQGDYVQLSQTPPSPVPA